MTDELLLPMTPHAEMWDVSLASERSCALVNAWIESRVERARSIFAMPQERRQPSGDANALVDAITDILTQRDFNFQSRSRLTSQIRKVRENLLLQCLRGNALSFVLLYNGGYRASPLRGVDPLIFEPDQTELLLLYQIALLSEKVRAVYPPGIRFVIVINNGVGLWVNDIPLSATNSYVDQFRKMIEWLGAKSAVELLVQSELAGFTARPGLDLVCPPDAISQKGHRLVERFLGRMCSPEEARYRHGLYALAEAKWAQDLSGVNATRDALFMRQVAHPEMLSFRPFPGGAIRIQNGSLGFENRSGGLSPKLITSETTQNQKVCFVPWNPSWFTPAQTPNMAMTCGL